MFVSQLFGEMLHIYGVQITGKYICQSIIYSRQNSGSYYYPADRVKVFISPGTVFLKTCVSSQR